MSDTESTKGPEGTAPQGPDGAPAPGAADAPAPAFDPAPPTAARPLDTDAALAPEPSLPPAADPAPAPPPSMPAAPLSTPAPPPSAYAAANAAPAYAPPPTEQTRMFHPPQGAPHMAAPGEATAWQPPGPPVPPVYARPGAPQARGKLVAGAIALALIAGAAGGVAGWFLGEGNSGTTVVESVSMDAGNGMTYTEIVDKIGPSVVTIVTDSAEGSGVVYSDDGYIVTNNHVVDGAQAVEVRFSDGSTSDASIVATDATQDLAVIQVADTDDLAPITFGDSDEIQVGDAAVAVGSPLGLEGTVTTGIVSALDRSMTVAGEEGQGPGQSSQTLTGLLQTDAAINSGNSGGALVDGNGDLIGINTAIATTDSGSIGLGFAIPSNTVQSVVQQLIEHGSVEQGYLGVSVADTDGNGAMILGVEPGSPAEDAGLQEGDIITAIDGSTVTTATEVVAAVQGQASGTEIAITYTRDEQEFATTATLVAS